MAKRTPENYEVIISRSSLAELRKGNVNVVMGLIARPRHITSDDSGVLAILSVVEIKSSDLSPPKKRSKR